MGAPHGHLYFECLYVACQLTSKKLSKKLKNNRY